eukprot:339259_1
MSSRMLNWLRRTFNPNHVEEFSLPAKHGHLKLQKVTKRSSFKTLRQTSLWRTGGPMITFTAFGGLLCYYFQTERLKGGDIYKSVEYENSLKHKELDIDEMLLEYQKRIVDPTLGIRPQSSSSNNF